MSFSIDKQWMKESNRRTTRYVEEVQKFIEFVAKNGGNKEIYSCPCTQCKNIKGNANPTKVITRRQVWEKAHTKKDGTISDNTSLYFVKLQKQRRQLMIVMKKSCHWMKTSSQAFGKDKKGRTRSIGTNISRTQVMASTIVGKQLKKAKGDTAELKSKMEYMEGKLENMNDTLKTLVNLVKLGQRNQIADVTFNEGGSSTRHESVGRNQINDVAAQLSSVVAANQQKCEILNFDLDVLQ